MKLTPPSVRTRVRQRGWALLVVVTLSACALMILASVMMWADSNAGITARQNEMFTTDYAAESATEKVLALMSQQYQNYGFTLVNQQLTNYGTNLPTATDSPYWTNYQFGSGTATNRLIVSNTTPSGVTNIVATNSAYAAYAGLTFVGNTYAIIANAQNINSENKIVSTVGQGISLGIIPLFQFAIFYQGDMEIEPGAAMTVSGPVHGNANMYLVPSDGLVFSNNVSTVGSISTNQSTNDPRAAMVASGLVFDGSELTNQPPLNLPVSTNTDVSGTNANDSAYGILELPQTGQTPSSSTGSNLLYNQADMIIIISNNNTISVTSGAGINNQATIISNNQYANWLSTSSNASFVDQRDGDLTVNPLVLNISNLVVWSSTNANLSAALGSVRPGQPNVQSIYVADLRSTSNSTVTTTIVTNANPVTTSFSPTSNYAPPITDNLATNTISGYTLPTNYVDILATYTVSATNKNNKAPTNGQYSGSYTHSSPNYYYKLITGYQYTTIVSYSYDALTYTTNYFTNWTTTSQPGIVLSNGAALPPQGLSIATPDPVYVIGNWNTKLTNSSSLSDAGSNVTTYSEPSAIYADAITILSPAWKSSDSAASLGSRVATSDTVNAAFLTGNVPSSTNGPNAAYSGGVENFPRFLEDWGNATFTYNGSMVQLFNSHIATNAWPNTGTVYNPPTRHWAFDQNYSNPAKQPPMTPKMIVVQRSQWAVLTPRSTTLTNASTY